MREKLQKFKDKEDQFQQVQQRVKDDLRLLHHILFHSLAASSLPPQYNDHSALPTHSHCSTLLHFNILLPITTCARSLVSHIVLSPAFKRIFHSLPINPQPTAELWISWSLAAI